MALTSEDFIERPDISTLFSDTSCLAEWLQGWIDEGEAILDDDLFVKPFVLWQACEQAMLEPTSVSSVRVGAVNVSTGNSKSAVGRAARMHKNMAERQFGRRIDGSLVAQGAAHNEDVY